MAEAFDHEKYLKFGYYLLGKDIPESLVFTALEGTDEMVATACSGNFPTIAVYRDYPYFSGGINVWGINCPTSKLIAAKNFLKLFEEYELEKRVLEATGWKRTACRFMRIHTSSDRYKYQGAWHRDARPEETESMIQVNLYLKNERGFRIVPTNKEERLLKNAVDEHYLGQSENLLLSSKYVDELSAEAGDVLFFKASALHQGVYCGGRRHVHLRFIDMDAFPGNKYERENDINFEDAYVAACADVANTLSTTGDVLGSTNRKTNSMLSKARRAIRLANYFLPIFRLYRERAFWLGRQHTDIGYSKVSNTFWQ